jgi:DNA-directed RNA polymerase specialized sigma24 family protein
MEQPGSNIQSPARGSDSDQTLDDILTLDEVGLSALHTRFYPEVYQFAYYRLHDDQLSEAVTKEVFLELLREARASSTHERNLRGWLMSCVSRRVNEQLQPGSQAYDGEGVTSFQAPQDEMVIDAEAQELSRQHFLAAARRRPRKKQLPTFKWARELLGLLLVLLVLAAVAALVASFWALPGSRLYPIKRILEQPRLLLVGSASQRLEVEKSIDENRLAEVNDLLKTGQGPVKVSLVGGLSQMSPDEWVVGDTLVKISPSTQLIGDIAPGRYLQVEGELQPQGFIQAQRVQPREYQIQGKLQRIQGDLWVVDGISIQVPPGTVLRGEPVAGSQVKLNLYRLLDDSLVARWVEIAGNENP